MPRATGVRRVRRTPSACLVRLVGKMLYGHTAPNRTITLYPDAFSSAENLTKTIGHERQHVMQIDTYGPATSLAQESAWERAAYASEGQFWNYYNGRLG